MIPEVGDLVLCTVDRIIGTVVFVKIEGNGEGSIITSEIAPGRIRNLRDYVVPKKKIVCKVLRIDKEGNIELTLRRVKQVEKKEVMEQYQKEKSSINILKSVLDKKAEEAINKILETDKVSNFLEEAKQNPQKLEELMGKKDSERILKILKLEKQKKAVVKKEILLKTTKSDGLKLIKEIFEEINGIEIRYVSAGRYSIKTESSNLKEAGHKLNEILEKIEKKAKKLGLDFSIKGK